MKNFLLFLHVALFGLLAGGTAHAQSTIVLDPERTGHAATRLSSGKVLITGGVNEGATLNSALLYDPATGNFAPTGTMVSARTNHTSTLLADGRVLITGGEDIVPLQTAEIYDPASGVFTQTSPGMRVPRSQHTATTLRDGTILLNGGKSADLFNPATETFTQTTGTPPLNRRAHASVLLADGSVFTTGGYVGAAAVNTAEIYDPVTQDFTTLPVGMLIPRANHSMTPLLDGTLLIAGGFSGTSPHDEVESYDPILQTFTLKQKMIYNRSNQRAFLLTDGRVLVIGGVTLESGFLTVNEVYNPVTGTWSVHSNLVEPRAGHSATALFDGTILVAGGVTGNLTLKTAEVIDPSTSNFTALGNMIAGRNQHTANLLPNGKVLLAAGSTDALTLKTAEVFDPLTDSFTAVGSLAEARKSHTATELADGRVLVAGGKSATGDLASAELFDPLTSLFQSTGSLSIGRALHTGTLLVDGEVLIVGGVITGGDETPTGELYDPVTETFTFTPGSLNLKRKRHRANLLLDGTVLLTGGNTLENSQQGGDRTTETAELYTPATRTFSYVEDMDIPRSEHQATLLADGTVVVTGGALTSTLTEVYQPGTQSFSPTGDIIQPRGRHDALRLTNPAWGGLVGKVLVIGGSAPGGAIFGGAQQAIDSVELYDPVTGTLSFFGTMTEARQNHTATELQDGRILIAGGVGRPFVSSTAELLAASVPMPTPTPTPGPTVTPSPTASPSPTQSPSPSPSPSGSPSPTPVESKPLNISTRGDAQTGDKVLIGGFILAGGSEPKTVILRAIGPSLPLGGVLADPVLELHNPDGSVVVNDNWRETQEAEIVASGLAPTVDQESAIIATLPPDLYTVIVKGKNDGTGVGLVEVYDLDDPNTATYLANISTRGFAQPGDNAMIGGFIIGEGGQTGQVVVRAIGPSLTGVPDSLLDPTLSLFNAQGVLVEQNDDWADTNGNGIAATGLAPSDSRESAILASLSPGAYTAIVEGKESTSGVGLVEIYYIQ